VTLLVRVERIRSETAEVRSFELVAPDGRPLPPYTAGSHIDVHPAPGLTRQYSLCDAPGAGARYLIAVKREPDSRGGSRAMHELKEGQALEIGAPRNNFALAAAASHHLLIAGGIGVTPLLSMAQHLDGLGASFDLHYFTRSAEHAAFRDVLSELRGKFHYALDVERVRARLRELLSQRRDGAHLYLCGPRPFMDLVEAAAAPAWPREAVHLEHFSADPRALGGTRDAFDIVLASSGARYTVAADKSIVQVLSEHGVEVPVSCEQGVCGTCLTRVLEGEPDHRDVFLTDEERRACDRMLLCVSRARSARLTLDL
jgi:vanillate O-demethylase ferredoxin subunit